MAKNKIIIDTDPGCDDVLALLLALASSPDDVEIVLISVTYGNISVKGCLQNVISTFHVIEKERLWRKSQGLPDGFDMLSRHKPMIAVGAEGPLGGQKRQADYYHGIDGLGGVHMSHPHFTPADTWSHLFEPPPPTPPTDDPITTAAAAATHESPPNSSHAFTPSNLHAVDQILSLLDTHPPDTLTLIALGPLTNFALAASRSATTFMRARRVCVMGGALAIPGNITPVGEFNTLADPLAAARVYALTSPNPASTMPPSAVLPPYPSREQLGPRRLKAVMFPLDVTTGQKLRERDIQDVCNPRMERGSPLAEWVSAFTRSTFERNRRLHVGEEVEMSLHDPVVVWNAVAGGDGGEEDGWRYDEDVDVRIETQGQWTEGMCVVDRRGRKLLAEKDDLMSGDLGEVSSDQGGWLSRHRGNRVDVCVGMPGGEGGCAEALLGGVFGR